MRLPLRIFIAATAFVLSACPPTPPVIDDGGADAGCAGQLSCECKADATCEVGECVGGSCVDCRRGEAACVCRANGTCNTGLRCEGATCQACPSGQQGCACDPGDVCGSGLICSNDVCVADTCVAGTNNCPCRATDPKCEGASYCDATSRCQTCSSDIAGCPCDANSTCQGTTVCDTGNSTCRNTLTCANLVTNGSCLPNQVCVEGSGGDATCTAMACVMGYQWDGAACRACQSADCSNEPSCSGADGGLSATCATQHRECVTSGQVAACGACLQGFTQNASGVCVAAPSCGSSTCALAEYCDRTGAPQCLPLPCPAGQARGANGTCAACSTTLTCLGAGFSGRVWPFRTTSSECVCETLDNYFLSAGGAATAERCDADDDGWVRAEADDLTVRNDDALRQNSRCSIRTASRVRLVDEYGQHVDVLSCAEGLVKATPAHTDGGYVNDGLHLLADGGLQQLADGGTGCSSVVSMRLLESLRNDLGGPVSTRFPIYGRPSNDGGMSGRSLVPSELNSLTKGCVSATADFNDNNADDLTEVQSRGPWADDQARLRSFAYFTEVQEAWWESGGANNAGILVVRERSRCDAEKFPLRYDPNVVPGQLPLADRYTSSVASPYWRNCARSRDALYDEATPRPNTDFARFFCDVASGTCTNLPGPAHKDYSAPVDATRVQLRNVGLCELNGQKPADGRWRGMNHHSQFKCASITTAVSDPSYQVAPASLGAGNDSFMFNLCAAKSCATADDPACSASLGSARQTRQPVIECTATATASNVTGFVAVTYRPATPYQRGCVSEDDPTLGWRDYLCPVPQYTQGASQEFGRYSCFNMSENFLWAPSDGGVRRATLTWGPNSNSSVFR